MVEQIIDRIRSNNVVILGFGREGQSTYSLIRKHLPGMSLTIADRNESIKALPVISGDPLLSFRLGRNYLNDLNTFDLVIKSPGITLKDLSYSIDRERITSQTDLFLENYAAQVIGVTGTKGKSTTASLIYHILRTAGKDTLLVGNIGTPAFHFLDQIDSGTYVVYELSSHQLEFLHRGPHIALILNIFQEHLDAYVSFTHYQQAKMNIVNRQVTNDVCIFSADDPVVGALMRSKQPSQLLIPCSTETEFDFGCFRKQHTIFFRLPGAPQIHFEGLHNRYLRGEHNTRNMMAAIAATALLRIDPDSIAEGVESFKGLAHRMEEVGEVGGIRFVNDSIATIPEACIAALLTIPDVDTLLLGGFDRGIDYSFLADFLVRSSVRNMILIGAAGKQIGSHLELRKPEKKQIFYVEGFDDSIPLIFKYTERGKCCLLSPAAASYDEFKSFEERGNRFVELVKEVGRMKE